MDSNYYFIKKQDKIHCIVTIMTWGADILSAENKPLKPDLDNTSGGNMILKILDIVGALFSLSSTVSYINVNIFAWPLGLISLFIDLYLYFHKGIYADMSLHFIYIFLTLYGWYEWKFGGKDKQELEITFITKKMLFYLSIFGLISYFILYLFLVKVTNSHVPMLDAITTILSIIAQFLICRKVIECWILWFIVDLFYSFLYVYKGLPFHGFLQLIYVIMAVIGYIKWSKERRKFCGNK